MASNSKSVLSRITNSDMHTKQTWLEINIKQTIFKVNRGNLLKLIWIPGHAE